MPSGDVQPSQTNPKPTIFPTQPSTDPDIGHVPEITGHVRRNTHWHNENIDAMPLLDEQKQALKARLVVMTVLLCS